MTEQVREQEGEQVGQEGSRGCVGRRPPRAPPRPTVRSSSLHGSCASGWVPHQATLGCPLTSLTPSSMERPSWAGLHLVDLGQSARFKYFAQLFTLCFLLVICVFRYEYFSELSPVCGLSFASLNSIFLKSMVLKVLVKSNSFFFFSGLFFGGCF